MGALALIEVTGPSCDQDEHDECRGSWETWYGEEVECVCDCHDTDPCDECEGTGQLGRSVRGHVLFDVCGTCNGQGR
ncbi:hypothetical protein [Phytoactinopolyspora limicola]|uniref:hypothetical protein n=1 Tax=Phytoactinopolyspora limicola TaxID=2715536 RepID=UPI001409FDAA|nr:hypothetical protein [Phytoactinopolyspora limicola]